MIVSKFLLTVGASLFVQAGAGCFSPTIIEDGRRSGDPALRSMGDGRPRWRPRHERMCAEHDRDAELVRGPSEALAEPNFREATFACIAIDFDST